MKKRLIALLGALILFLTGCTTSKSEGSNDPIEVLNTSEPTKQIEETISMLTKETEPIIIEETTVVIETQPIIETEPVTEEPTTGVGDNELENETEEDTENETEEDTESEEETVDEESEEAVDEESEESESVDLEEEGEEKPKESKFLDTLPVISVWNPVSI